MFAVLAAPEPLVRAERLRNFRMHIYQATLPTPGEESVKMVGRALRRGSLPEHLGEHIANMASDLDGVINSVYRRLFNAHAVQPEYQFTHRPREGHRRRHRRPHMARFVIADLTDAKSVLQELRAIVPTNPSVPVQPLILTTQEEPGMFDFFRLYHCMLEAHRYTDSSRLLAALTDQVIAPAEG